MRPIVKELGGARLFVLPTDRFKSEYLSVRFLVPMRERESQKNALMLAVLARGCEKYPSKLLINRRLDEMYSTTVSVHHRRLGDMQSFGLSADFLAARYVGGGLGLLPELFSVLSDIFYAPLRDGGLLRTDFVESEKGFLRDAIRAKINNPRGYALAECRKLLFAGEPFALPLLGEEETLDEIDAAVMTGHHEQFARELVPTFFYAGSTPADEVAALILQYFPRLSGKRHPYRCIVSPHVGEARFGEVEMPVCQGKLTMGFRTDVSVGHPLEAATMVLNEIYGGSPASKLFLNVRERMGLCYHCSSAWHGYKGVMFASAGMKPDNFEVTRDAMLREFDAVASGDITVTEMEAAKRSLSHHFRQLGDNPAALCSIYANRGEAGDLSPIEGLADAISRTTREDVSEAAAHLRRGATFFLRGTDAGEEADE